MHLIVLVPIRVDRVSIVKSYQAETKKIGGSSGAIRAVLVMNNDDDNDIWTRMGR